ncbi:MAG: hypothetical protein Tsb009_10550 [Planctomycetaceae bacterium]
MIDAKTRHPAELFPLDDFHTVEKSLSLQIRLFPLAMLNFRLTATGHNPMTFKLPTLQILFISAVLSVVVSLNSVQATNAAEEKGGVSPVLKSFSDAWDESAWLNKSRFRPKGYMRPLNDKGWQARMRAMQSLVAQGESAVPGLLKTLKSGSVPERILAAQTLGYLAPHVPVDALFQAAKNDPDPAVRLYAVDSLGMQGVSKGKINWDALKRSEKNGDVRKHIGYAQERKSVAVEKKTVKKLVKWNPEQIAIAKIGKPAPDFSLKAVTGETIQLKQFRGKKPVVLVFIYGDT